MCAHRINLESDKETVSYPNDAELSSFVQNIATVESIMFRVEMELAKYPPDGKRLEVFMKDAWSLQVELVEQARRAIAVGGLDDPNVLRFEDMKSRVAMIVELADRKREDNQKALELSKAEGVKIQAELDAAAADAQARIDKLESNPDLNGDPEKSAEIREEIATEMRARIAEISAGMEARLLAGLVSPPPPPVDTPPQSEDDDSMDARLTALEKDMALVKADVGVIRATMATKDDVHVVMNALELIKADATTMKGTFATKVDLTSEVGSLRTDIAKMEATILRWFIGTAFTIAGLAFVAAKFVK